MEPKYVTLITHEGFEIQTLTQALPDQFGYIIDHTDFEGKTFDLIQDAMEAIDDLIERREI